MKQTNEMVKKWSKRGVVEMGGSGFAAVFMMLVMPVAIITGAIVDRKPQLIALAVPFLFVLAVSIIGAFSKNDRSDKRGNAEMTRAEREFRVEMGRRSGKESNHEA
jgi:choline-glycine betaine transporter